MGRGRQILVVDDEAEVVRGISLWLAAAGFATYTAANGDDIVATAQKCKPHAIVLDVRMPGRDGLGVLEELRRSEGTMHIPVVMLSASLVDQQRALDAGARFFLPKPYEGKHLVAALKAAIGDPPTSEPRHERS
jgi:CheY-like chemotaxis protein